MSSIQRLKQRARALKTDIGALALACRDPRVPLSTRLLAMGVVAYVLSPIDLVPDFVPVPGLLDDLILLPLGIALVLRSIPPQVLDECRQRSRLSTAQNNRCWGAAVFIVVLWLTLAAFSVYVFLLWKHKH